MFPGIDGFHWTVGHILFLSIFFAVVLTILTTVLSAVWRTRRDFRTHHAVELCWKSDFAELPESDRRCRHELAGRVTSRTCNNAFDCRHCNEYAKFAAMPPGGLANNLGMHYSEDCFYHRGHTWVRPEEDGTLAIGLDELARHLVGDPDWVTLPEIGTAIDLNGPAWYMRKNGNEIQVRAPIEGTVTAVGGPRQEYYLKVQPRLDPRDPIAFRHLLQGPEVRGWMSRELDRLQIQLRAPNTAPSLADGGTLMPNLMDNIPDADWPAVLADTFLQA